MMNDVRERRALNGQRRLLTEKRKRTLREKTE